MSKLYFHKCAHFFLFLSLSTFFIHHIYPHTKILTLTPLIPTLISRIPTPIYFVPTLNPCTPTLIPRIPITPTLIHGISTLTTHIPIISLIEFPNTSLPAFTDNQPSLVEGERQGVCKLLVIYPNK